MTNKKNKIVAIIPARGGSKRIPKKNIKKLAGKPLIYWSIKAAKNAKLVDRVIVTTDDKNIAAIAKKYGAEIPFMRPSELATDESLVIETLRHAVSEIAKKDGAPDIIVMLQTTAPLVESEDIDAAISKMLEKNVSSCVGVRKVKERPEWMFMKNGENFSPYTKPSTARSQDLPDLYCLNGAVYVTTYKSFIEKNSLSNWNSFTLHIMPENKGIDIDDLEDFKLAEIIIKKRKNEK